MLDSRRDPGTVAANLTPAQVRAMRVLRPGVVYDYRYVQGVARNRIWHLGLIDRLPGNRGQRLTPKIVLTEFGVAVREALQRQGLPWPE